MKHGQWLLIGIIAWAGFWSGGSASAQTVEKTPPPAQVQPTQTPEEPTIGTGDSFKSNRQEGTLTYSGNAKFVWQDLNVFCDELKIYSGASGPFEKAEATGNVRVVTQDTTATGERGIYYGADQKIELMGKARVVQGKNTIAAQRIIASLTQKLVEGYSDGTTDRVVMTVYTQPPSTSEEKTAEPAANASEAALAMTTVEAETLQYDNAVRMAVFTGNVKATKDQAQIFADTMQVYLAGGAESTTNDIEKIELTGKIRILQDTVAMTGAKGVYQYTDQSVIMEGSAEEQAQVEDKSQNTILTADWIKVALTTNEIEAKGNVRTKTVPPTTKPPKNK